MSDTRDRLLEVALEEHFGAGPDVDLPERILAASHARPRAPVPRRHVLQAAGLAAAAALIGWAVFAPGAKLPDTVKASGEFSVHEAEIEARSGWYVLERGAPPMRHAGTRVEQVTGRVLVKTGEIPDANELAEMEPWLRRQNLEEEMRTGRWVKAGTLAVCLMAGSVVVDGNVLSGQAMERKRVQELEQELAEARKKLAEAEEEARRQAGKGNPTLVPPADTRNPSNPEDAGIFKKLMEDLEEEARRAKNKSDNPTVIPPVRRTDTPHELPPEDVERLIDELRKVEEEARQNTKRTDGPTVIPPREFDLPSEKRRAEEERDRSERELDEIMKALKEAEEEARRKILERDAEAARSAPIGPSRFLDKAWEPKRGNSMLPKAGNPPVEVDAALELKKLLNDKDVELAMLQSRPDPDAKRIREVEASMAALRAALEALEKQKDR